MVVNCYKIQLATLHQAQCLHQLLMSEGWEVYSLYPSLQELKRFVAPRCFAQV